jgi:hypothetical protein
MTDTKTLRLLSHDKWLDVADYRISTHTIENIRHVDSPEDLKFLEISGRYGTVGSEKIVVNFDNSFRTLVLGFEHDAQFALSNCDVQWTQLDETLAQLTITHESYTRSVTYPHHRDWVEDDFNFDMSSYEDFDFGLWIYGLKADPDLRQRLTQEWAGAAGARHGGSIV